MLISRVNSECHYVSVPKPIFSFKHGVQRVAAMARGRSQLKFMLTSNIFKFTTSFH